MNHHVIFGRLGKDPELTYTTSGTPCAKFSVATSEKWKDKEGNKQEQTQWHNIVAWKKPAEIIAEYFKKGSQILLTGKVITRSWEGQDGKKNYMTETILRDFEFAGEKVVPKDGQPERQDQPPQPSGSGETDLPF